MEIRGISCGGRHAMAATADGLWIWAPGAAAKPRAWRRFSGAQAANAAQPSVVSWLQPRLAQPLDLTGEPKRADVGAEIQMVACGDAHAACVTSAGLCMWGLCQCRPLRRSVTHPTCKHARVDIGR